MKYSFEQANFNDLESLIDTLKHTELRTPSGEALLILAEEVKKLKMSKQKISFIEVPVKLTKGEFARLKQLYRTNKSDRYRVPKGRGQYPATELDASLPRLILPKEPGAHPWKDYDVIEIKASDE